MKRRERRAPVPSRFGRLFWALNVALGFPFALLAAVTNSAPGIPIKVPPGFKVEVVYRVPRDQGSWVCLALDAKGRFITSDQFGKLYRLTLDRKSEPQVEAIVLEGNLGSAQGLLWAFDSLYVVANRKEKHGGSGLYRLYDRDGDDRFEEVRLLRELEGDGEHGPHGIVLGPDKRSLFLVAGNGTFLPEGEPSLVSPRWAMDALLPPLGESDGVWRTNRPGGWICRLDPEGKAWEVVAVGLRNPYDLAFNGDGELFTFDSDMEWDAGTPWYRPTRVNHIISGAEFGWRTGGGKWPDFYSDSLGSVVDVGESSPTGLTFGYGARFPAKYQRALFMGDWSYGKIYAVTLEPDGATYRGKLQSFLSGSPLPVTDLVIRPEDGALYFLTGGRETASVLYRVAYRGFEATRPVTGSEREGRKEREQRRALARFQSGVDEVALEGLWPFLGHTNRVLRYSARIVLEQQPLVDWQYRALNESRVRSKLTALMALARCAGPAVRPRVMATLRKLEWKRLGTEEQLDLLRVYGLTCLRLGPLPGEERASLLDQLGSLFPCGSYELDRELSQLLIYLNAPGIVPRVLSAMETAPSQEEQLHYAVCLRTFDQNTWTSSERERYFRWFGKAMAAGGGVTYSEYLTGIRREVIEKLNDSARKELEPLLGLAPPVNPYLDLRKRNFVREWTVKELLPAVDANKSRRDLEQGRRIFTTAMCIKCHRFNRQGGLGGPDLTGVGNRFDNRALLESIIEPTKVISDQYATVEVQIEGGESFTGRIGDQNDDEILLKADLLNPASIRRIKWEEIESVVPSTQSLMPASLLSVFTQDEILDLIAYLKSGGK